MVGACPPFLLRSAAFVLGTFGFSVLRVRRRTVIRNLNIAFGNSICALEKRCLARRSYQNFFLTLFEFLGSRVIFPRADIEIINGHELSQALAGGQGAYILVTHQGNWELLCYAGNKYFAPVYVPVKPVGKGAVAQWVQETRLHNGLHEVLGQRGETLRALRLLKALKAGNMVGFMVDQRKNNGFMTPFFGAPAATNTGLATLWLRQPSPVIPVVIHRVNKEKHQMIFFPPMAWNELRAECTDSQTFVEKATAQVNKQAETMIRMFPEEYFWMHDRWKGLKK